MGTHSNAPDRVGIVKHDRDLPAIIVTQDDEEEEEFMTAGSGRTGVNLEDASKEWQGATGGDGQVQPAGPPIKRRTKEEDSNPREGSGVDKGDRRRYPPKSGRNPRLQLIKKAQRNSNKESQLMGTPSRKTKPTHSPKITPLEDRVLYKRRSGETRSIEIHGPRQRKKLYDEAARALMASAIKVAMENTMEKRPSSREKGPSRASSVRSHNHGFPACSLSDTNSNADSESDGEDTQTEKERADPRHETDEQATGNEDIREGNLNNSSRLEYYTQDDKLPVVADSQTVYRAACRRLRIKPLQQVLNHIHEAALQLDFLHLGDLGTAALSLPLVHNKCVTRLQLPENAIGEEGIRYLCTMLTANRTISYLDVSENRLGQIGAKYLGELLTKNRTLTSLIASGNDFKDIDATYLAEGLKKNRRLVVLNLSHNQFDEKAGHLFGDALCENDYLQTLNLSWNHLRHRGAIAFATAMKENCTIKTLDLSWNGFSNDGAKAIGQCLFVNESLRDLDLSSNRIHLEGAISLAKGIAKNTSLETLKLSRNPITNKGACRILDAIASNEYCQISNLQIVNVEINMHFELLLDELNQRRPLMVTHGCIVSDDPYGEPTRPRRAVVGDPAMLLFTYAKSSGLRLMDLFAQFDADNNLSVCREEFKVGLKRIQLPLSDLQIDKLFADLDADGDGEIDFKELLEGQRHFRDRERRRHRGASQLTSLSGSGPHTPVLLPDRPVSPALTEVANKASPLPPRVGSPRLTMTSPLGKAALMNATQYSETISSSRPTSANVSIVKFQN